MTGWIIVLAIGAGTYLARLSFIGAFARRDVPRALEAPLRYVAPAVLAAIAAPAVIAPTGAFDLTPGNLELVAALGAGLAAWRTRSIAVTIVVGLVGLGILEALF